MIGGQGKPIVDIHSARPEGEERWVRDDGSGSGTTLGRDICKSKEPSGIVNRCRGGARHGTKRVVIDPLGRGDQV